jgi:hypothetical protein
MQRFRQPALLYLVTALLFWGQTGVGLHKMYCLCTSQLQTGLWTIEDACHKEAFDQKDVCCSKQKGEAQSVCVVAEDKKPCSSHSFEWLKLDTDLQHEQEVPFPLYAHEALLDLEDFKPLFYFFPYNLITPIPNYSGPPLSGWKRRLFMASVLC